MSYTLHSGYVIRTTDNKHIPLSSITSDDLIEYHKWLSDGNIPSAPVYPVTSITRYQARMALRNAGLLQTVEAKIDQAGIAAQMAWRDSTSFDRNSVIVQTIADGIGFTSVQMDELFNLASNITS